MALSATPKSTTPSPPTGSTSTRYPSPRSAIAGSKTELCSAATVTTFRRPLAARAPPITAILLASVAPDVNTTRRASPPTARATCRRATITARAASVPEGWLVVCGFP